MKISWVSVAPNTGLAPNSIYVVDPKTGNKPQVLVTNKTGSKAYQINPDVDITQFIQTINSLQKDGSGNVLIDISFNNGKLKVSGTGTTEINLDTRYVNLTDFNSKVTNVEGRLSSLETAITEGLKTPKPFDASTNSTFPNQRKGFTYKVTKDGVVSGQQLRIGDTIIYDSDGTNPFVVQANVDMASVSVAGLVQLATEQEAIQGTNNTQVITPLVLKEYVNRVMNSSHSNHTHPNKPTLDKLSEDNGSLMFGGSELYSVGVTEW